MLDFDAILAGVVRGHVRFAVTGGRRFGVVPADTPQNDLPAARRKAQREIEYLQRELDTIHVGVGLGYLVVGDATGADKLARTWAFNRKITSRRFNAEWKKYGKQAGPIRNLAIIDEGEPELLIAFPGGVGTDHMVRTCKLRGIPVIELPGPDPE